MQVNEWHCLLCGVRLHGLRQQSAHMKNYNLNADDPSRCDNLLSRQEASPTNIIYEPDFTSQREEIPVAAVAGISLLTRRCSSECNGDKYMNMPIPRALHGEVDAAALDFGKIENDWER